jgi:hypothetical protein
MISLGSSTKKFDFKKFLELTSGSLNSAGGAADSSVSADNNNVSSTISDDDPNKAAILGLSQSNVTSNSYLMNQAIIYKKIAEYNQEKAAKFVKVSLEPV